jgi:dTDP-4-dehydrorhamnose 3,5-epimerase
VKEFLKLFKENFLMTISVKSTAIPDVLIIEPKVFSDDRGFFFESFNENDFSKAIGEKVIFVQDNHSFSKKGVLRGLHYQMEQTQGKLVRVVCGTVFDVAVDLRQSSNTFGKWVGVELSAENKKQVWIPAGFAHGFLVLSEAAEFLYKTTANWHAGSEQCINWSDQALAINWPDIGMQPILNSKDSIGLCWSDAPKF